MAAMMLPMATKMPLAAQDEASRLDVVLGRKHHGVQHRDLLLLEPPGYDEIPGATRLKRSRPESTVTSQVVAE
jgi:hypothetical protein